MQDLYRLGFIGNYLPYSKTYRWQHKGDNGLILADNYRLMVHYALHAALSLGKKQDRALESNDSLEPGDVVSITVVKVIKTHAFVKFFKGTVEYNGCIYFKNTGLSGYIDDLRNYINVGYECKAEIIRYNEEHKNWELAIDVGSSEISNH